MANFKALLDRLEKRYPKSRKAYLLKKSANGFQKMILLMQIISRIFGCGTTGLIEKKMDLVKMLGQIWLQKPIEIHFGQSSQSVTSVQHQKQNILLLSFLFQGISYLQDVYQSVLVKYLHMGKHLLKIKTNLCKPFSILTQIRVQ